MDKLRMQTANKADENFKKLAAMFPNAVTETINENGEVVRAIDKDMDNVIKRERAHKKVVAKCFRCRLKGRIDHPQQGEKYKEAYQQQG